MDAHGRENLIANNDNNGTVITMSMTLIRKGTSLKPGCPLANNKQQQKKKDDSIWRLLPFPFAVKKFFYAHSAAYSSKQSVAVLCLFSR
jgi:hypothetical protein